MTAPDRTTWTVAEDGEHEPTLWYGDVAVLRFHDLVTLRWRVGTPQEQAERDDRLYLVWQVLTRVLAPDEATLMLLSQRVDSHALTLDDEAGRRDCVEDVLAALADSRDPLAALAGTSAQARQPTQESGMHEHARDAAGYCRTCDAGPPSDLPEPSVDDAKARHTDQAMRRLIGDSPISEDRKSGLLGEWHERLVPWPHLTAEEAADCPTCSPSGLPRRIEEDT